MVEQLMICAVMRNEGCQSIVVQCLYICCIYVGSETSTWKLLPPSLMQLF